MKKIHLIILPYENICTPNINVYITKISSYIFVVKEKKIWIYQNFLKTINNKNTKILSYEIEKQQAKKYSILQFCGCAKTSTPYLWLENENKQNKLKG